MKSKNKIKSTVNNLDTKCFNCNKYRHMAKECRLKKKEHETRKCFKCKKEKHIAKDYKETQLMKKQKIQEESDDEEDKKEEQDFGEDLK